MDNPETRRIFAHMTADADIIIVGGGLNGPALALALSATGFQVTVVDALPRDTRDDRAFDGRAYALALASKRLLAAIGVWSQVADNAQPMLDIKVTDGHVGAPPSPFFMHFDHAEIEEGPMGFMVEDRHLRDALMTAMDDADGITQVNGAAVIEQSTDRSGVSVTLDNGSMITGRVLIGSDGRRSGTARRGGVKRTERDYGQTALVCALHHDLPHHGVAHQVFMPPGPLAILPLTGNRSSIVWSEKSDTAASIQAMSPEDYLQVLRPRFGDFLGRIELAGQRYTYPLNLSLANALIAERLALIGDAAHGLHPIAGQGLNAGLRDVGALAEVLTLAARRGEDPGARDVLERYQQWRRFDTVTLALATDAFNRLFSNDNPLLRLGRDIGMGLVGSMPGLRRGFIREAAGLTGDLPRLMRGEAI
ncbi:MAG: FAD-dependent monooxygenase [Pseudomonadota bacterium]